MNINVYKQKVRELFESGEATDEMWDEMTACVLYFSEQEHELYPEHIDLVITNDK